VPAAEGAVNLLRRASVVFTDEAILVMLILLSSYRSYARSVAGEDMARRQLESHPLRHVPYGTWLCPEPDGTGLRQKS
jgi:hypothetical protein